MPRDTRSVSFFFYILLTAVSSLACLIIAIYVVETRQRLNATSATTTWKQLDTFTGGAKIIENNKSSQYNNYNRFITHEQKGIIRSDLTLLNPMKSNYSGNIFMDWPGDSDDFDYTNYKSLESLLSTYPNAKVTVNLIAPNAAHYYKIGNLISKHFFQKYQKHGYDISIKIVYRKFRERFSNDVLPPGSLYWNEEFIQRCESSKAAEISQYRDIPAHMYFFLRFFTLWAHGGFYSDFSWFHSAELLVVTQQVEGSLIKIYCPRQSLPTRPQLQRKRSESFAQYERKDHCKASVLLSFPKNSPVAYCMLLKYNDTSSAMRNCFDDDVRAEGVNCILTALSDCYKSENMHNQFMNRQQSEQLSQQLSSTTVVGCAAPENENENGDGNERVKEINEEFVNGRQLCGMAPEVYHTVLFERNSPVRVHNNSAVVWLGPSAYYGKWALPTAGSTFDTLIKRKLLEMPGPLYNHKLTLNESNQNNQNKINPLSHDMPYAPYPLSVLGSVQRTESNYLNQLRMGNVTYRRAHSGCRHYNYSVPLPESLANQAKSSCTLHFVVPGFMKAGTTYLFGTLMTHPMLLHTLRGVTFKETGCYGAQYTQPKITKQRTHNVGSKNNYGSNNTTILAAPNAANNFITYNRMHCFPFVESAEEMYFGDGTVWYNSHLQIPDSLLADNPGIKVIFSVRNPIHRTQSQHRFIYKTLRTKASGGNLNDVIHYLLDPNNDAGNGEGSLTSLHAQALDILSEQDPARRENKTQALVWNFQHRAWSKSKHYRALNQLIKYSIYFPPIYYWFRKIPQGNVLVVPVELLQAQKQSVDTKLAYLRNLSTLEDFERIHDAHISAQQAAAKDLVASKNNVEQRLQQAYEIEESAKRDAKIAFIEKQGRNSEDMIARQRIAPLNNAYTAAQYNRIYRYLGLPTVTEVADADSHHTGDKEVPDEHKLNDTSKVLLYDFFKPFNELLENFVGDHIGYNDW